jgi:hypothetical protein
MNTAGLPLFRCPELIDETNNFPILNLPILYSGLLTISE